MNWPGFNPRQVQELFLVKMTLQEQVFSNSSSFNLALLFDLLSIVIFRSYATDDI